MAGLVNGSGGGAGGDENGFVGERAAVEDSNAVTVYELELEDDGSPSKQRSYIRLPPPVEPYVLRISLNAGSLASKSGVLHTNFPLDGSDFEREKFHQKILPSDFSKPIKIDLPISKAGVFHFFVEYDAGANHNSHNSRAITNGASTSSSSSSSSSNSTSKRVRSAMGAFNVDPVLTIPRRAPILSSSDSKPLDVKQGGGKVLSDSAPLPLDGLVIQSVIAKWMGTIDQWSPHLAVTRDRGYNMLHFTPLQQRGESGSPYSIYDQMAFDDALFADGSKMSVEAKQKGVKELLSRIRKEYGILSLTDVVWNHTANNSLWLEDHPEAGYNVVNSPHLQAALELDNALLNFSSSLESLGLPTELTEWAHLEQIMSHISQNLIPSIKLWEYYVIDVASEKARFAEAWSSASSVESSGGIQADLSRMSRKEVVDLFGVECLGKDWTVLGERYNARVQDYQRAVAFMAKLGEMTSKEDRPAQAVVDDFAKILDDLNVDRYKTFNDDVTAILENTKGRIDYTRLAGHGPKLGKITPKSPLVESLFTRLPKNERTSKHDPRSLSLANNGWIWNANPLVDFASAHSRAYVRREVIVWGDCVKLRYGAGPEDNPFLWKQMTAYTELLAGMFDGFRIDNCHSTPIHVGEKLLDAARRTNPNLYVCAELFTGSEEMDTHFVRQLGLNSLIREAMNGNDPKDTSRLLYIYGVGKPVGSMDADCLTERSTIKLDGETKPCTVVPLQGSTPHAFMMDCTHDNESPADKRTARDALPTGALVTFCWSAVGSNKGFDDLYPKLLNLVTDTRHYETYEDASSSGIGLVKRVMNHIHIEMAVEGYSEGHLHQEGDYIVSHRVHPKSHKGYLVVAHTSFRGNTSSDRGHVPPVVLRGSKATFVVGGTLEIASPDDLSTKQTFKGLSSQFKQISSPLIESKVDHDGPYDQVIVPDYFPPGSVMVFSTYMQELSSDIDDFCTSGAKEAFSRLDVVDLNIVLFRADGEERDATGGRDGTYHIPDYGSLVYCGLEGFMHPLREIMRTNDLGHALCSHLRNGPWAMDYVYNRLMQQKEIQPRLLKPAQWFKSRFDAVNSKAPAFMRPKYFAMIINAAYKAARDRAFTQCSAFVQDGHAFTQSLALVALQMYGRVLSASLHPSVNTPSLAAGLPHFAAGWARCWGRDVFISLRGLFLTTGLFDAAREHILAFCSTLKHGLIPNLLDSIRSPRYNSRDSPWWMLQNIQDYAKMSPEGDHILEVPVKRRFPLNDEWCKWNDRSAYSYSSTVAEIIQEILQRHASGIHFREYNAGPNLDMQMSDEGFNIDIEVDWSTGFILGGNARNCGTWMDKMGESAKTGNKGFPGTPRDGAPVEITGLLKSCLTWVDSLVQSGRFPFKGVEATVNGSKRTVSYKEWADLLQANFEKYYYVPKDAKEDGQYEINPTIVARRGIYKDVYGTPKDREYSDYQLRPNFPVAMCVAPELFKAEHALEALKTTHEALLGPLGMKTLDPRDHAYRGNYDNSNDGDDKSIAKGWNYHQGPEWVWPIGYFLRAYLYFDTRAGAGKEDVNETLHHIHSLLLEHRRFVANDAWAGLPELTNENGAYCHDSCRTQAWSASTILDLLDDVAALPQSKVKSNQN